MKLKALIHAAEEGGVWAEAPALPGCAFPKGSTALRPTLAETMTVAELLDQIRKELRWTKSRQRHTEWWKERLSETKLAELTSSDFQGGLTALQEGAGREMIARNPKRGVQRPQKSPGPTKVGRVDGPYANLAPAEQRHVRVGSGRLAYDKGRPGGRLATYLTAHWRFGSEWGHRIT